MTGDDFLSLARRMVVTHQAEPAALRTVVSRAYYGVFHNAKALLEDLGFPVPKSENAHLFVEVRLRHANRADACDAGALLGDLHERRKRADYDLGSPRYETLEFAAEAIHRADRLRETLKKCGQEPARTDTTRGIAAYHSIATPKA